MRAFGLAIVGLFLPVLAMIIGWQYWATSQPENGPGHDRPANQSIPASSGRAVNDDPGFARPSQKTDRPERFEDLDPYADQAEDECSVAIADTGSPTRGTSTSGTSTSGTIIINTSATVPASQPAPTEGTRLWAQTTEMIDTWSDAIRNHPDLQLASASQLLRNRNYQSAADGFDRLMVAHPEDPVILQGKALALTGLGRHFDALPLYERLAEMDPDNDLAHYNTAVCRMRCGKFDEAVVSLETAIRLEPDRIRYHYNLAVACQAAGHPDEALVHWRHLTQPPLRQKLSQNQWLDIMVHLGEAAMEAGEPAEAARVFEQLCIQQPETADHWCNWGIALARQFHRQAAREKLQRALAIDPELIPALNQLAYIYAADYRDAGRRKDRDQVLELCRQSLKVHGDQPNIRSLRQAVATFDPDAEPEEIPADAP